MALDRSSDFYLFFTLNSHISPARWGPYFLTNQHGLKESDRGSPYEHFHKINLKNGSTLSEERFFSFHYSHIRQNSHALPPPGGHVFWSINMAWRNLIEGHPRNLSTTLFENRPDTFGEEDFLSFHFSNIRQKGQVPWVLCFLTNQHDLKESDRGSPKEHFSKENYIMS